MKNKLIKALNALIISPLLIFVITYIMVLCGHIVADIIQGKAV